MKFKVINVSGKAVKDIEIQNSIWAIKPHQQALYDTVIAQQAALRQGTRKTKTRAEVSGGGRKPWRQKGTGRARQGSIRSPQWRGGGITFGPTPNINYKKMVNKKVRQLAFKSALSLKVKKEELIIIDQFSFEKPSTKEMIKVMKNLKIEEQKTLFVSSIEDDNLNKSTSNIPGTKSFGVAKLNIFDLLNANRLVITVDAVQKIEEVYA